MLGGAQRLLSSAAAVPGIKAQMPRSLVRLAYTVLEAPEHALLGHVERPARVAAVVQALEASGLLAHTQARAAQQHRVRTLRCA